ncbi:MAG TPA: response regulator [Anaerolineales bacterium]
MEESEKIRVLIVDDIAETRENIRKLLQFENDIEVVGAARTGGEGIDLAKETRPDVILMDINMPDMDGITATETIRRDLPFTQIVILSIQGDPNYMRRAMLAGARDFLTKPPSVDELISAIRRAGQMAHEEQAKARPAFHIKTGALNPAVLGMPAIANGKVISIYSPKGGTGATTIATNLAVALKSEDETVVLVDGNIQFGDVAVFLNEQGRNSVVDLAPRADELDPEIMEEVLIDHAASGLKVLASPSRPEEAENVSGEEFTKVLDYLRQMSSYILVDTATSLTDVTLSIIDASDLILLIATQDIPAIKNARLFLDLMDIMKVPRDRILLVMNRYDKRVGITAEKVGENFKHPVSAVLPFEDRVVVPSVNRGVPFMLGDRNRPIARSILSLADTLKQSLESIDADSKNGRQEPARIGRR